MSYQIMNDNLFFGLVSKLIIFFLRNIFMKKLQYLYQTYNVRTYWCMEYLDKMAAYLHLRRNKVTLYASNHFASVEKLPVTGLYILRQNLSPEELDFKNLVFFDLYSTISYPMLSFN